MTSDTLPPHGSAPATANIALVSDRLGWEEQRLLRHFPRAGLHGQWVNEEALCLGRPRSGLPGFDLALIRSRSYVRGRLIASLLEAAGTPTVNRPEAIRLCENKLDLRRTLTAAGLPVPAFRLVLSRHDLHRSCEELGLPLVLKPLYGGGGRRVLLLRERDTLDCFYDCIDDLGHGFERSCLAEPLLPGPVLRCLVVGRRPVATARFAASGTEWRSNAAAGGTAQHHPTAEGEDLAQRAAAVLGPGIYGIDLFTTGAGLLIGEINHAPCYRTLAAAAPADITEAIADHLREVVG
ncbi:RimK family alpha-L-glutamate ligase [Streptomyces sp. ODS28]|uniref:ATP-grasp domain-containing protein n=1 Tax=Streptomyces sp. ODS28 TaxID=3136688 RepID=UPI0031E94CAA